MNRKSRDLNIGRAGNIERKSVEDMPINQWLLFVMTFSGRYLGDRGSLPRPLIPVV